MNACCTEKPEIQRSLQVQIIPAISQLAPQWSGIAVIDMKIQQLSSQCFAGKYLVLLFYPCNFSFVCPNELIQFSDRLAEFRALGKKLTIDYSCFYYNFHVFVRFSFFFFFFL